MLPDMRLLQSAMRIFQTLSEWSRLTRVLKGHINRNVSLGTARFVSPKPPIFASGNRVEGKHAEVIFSLRASQFYLTPTNSKQTEKRKNSRRNAESLTLT